jgi:AhpC/TSA family
MYHASTYNYEHFSFALEAPELGRWLWDGPHVGEPATDFTLEDLDHVPVRLSALRGAPVMVEFGSYSAPIFSDRVPAMERHAVEHPEAQFFVIAVREAHPGEITGPHTTLTEKRQAARRMAIEDGTAAACSSTTYTAACTAPTDPVYVIDPKGRIAFAGRGTTQTRSHTRSAPSPTDTPRRRGVGRDGAAAQSRGDRAATARARRQDSAARLHRTAPLPVRTRLREAPSAAVRAVIEQEEQ